MSDNHEQQPEPRSPEAPRQNRQPAVAAIAGSVALASSSAALVGVAGRFGVVAVPEFYPVVLLLLLGSHVTIPAAVISILITAIAGIPFRGELRTRRSLMIAGISGVMLVVAVRLFFA